jgi:hypothetical protein
MIIDPDRDGCTIWEGNKVQYIKGNAHECIEKIVTYITFPFDDGIIGQWHFNILLDTTVFGQIYTDYLNKHGIKFEEIKVGKIL